MMSSAQEFGGKQRRQCPPDFDTKFVELGRLQCEEHYHARRTTITAWLNERGKQRLVAERAANVRAGRQRISRSDMTKILAQAFPVEGAVSFTLARHAAQFLRIRRNGGWIISPAGEGQWWVGARRRSAAELLAIAEAAGFDPANLRDEGGEG